MFSVLGESSGSGRAAKPTEGIAVGGWWRGLLELVFVSVVLFLSAAAHAQSTRVTFTVQTPEGLHHNEIAIGASDTLDLRDGVKIEQLVNGVAVPARVANLGSGQTELGVEARSATVYANGGAFLRGSSVAGDVHVGGTLNKQHGTLIGGRTYFGKFETAAITWEVEFPSAVSPVPTGNAILQPGAYSGASIGSGQVITLKPGTYTFSSFRMEPQSKLVFDNGGATSSCTSRAKKLR